MRNDKPSSPSEHLDSLTKRYPTLFPVRRNIEAAFNLLHASYRAGGKLLLCGNGGSACDAEHITGELMKSFLLKRPLTKDDQSMLSAFGEDGADLAATLQGALPAIPLTGMTGLSSAFANDADPALTFAQQAWALTKPNDVILCISTSGDARNCRLAAIAAKVRGAAVIGLTGAGGGKLTPLCDALIAVPETSTAYVQELHLPVYHALCAMLEATFFSQSEVEA
ncbi:MAG: SIS domain-containing protein [Oscillospiraceae bacterium]|jgi:D-sedoheptulose 7-phosphate isomerase|nr:SIS domain-containing protein [Oscillospiraceae bacterium]